MTINTEHTQGNGTSKLVKLIEPVEIRVVLLYLIQKLQTPTRTELLNTAKEKLHCSIHPHTSGRVLTGLAKGGFIAINSGQREDGNVEQVYSMKDLVRWQQPPEYAHILNLLPELIETDQARAMKDWFDKHETNDTKTDKKNSGAKQTKGNVVRDYFAFEARCRLLSPIIGSQIKSAFTDSVRKQFPNELDAGSIEFESVFDRDPLTGDYIIAQDVLQGWFASNVARYCNIGDARAMYVAFQPVVFPYKTTPVGQIVLPVPKGSGGGGGAPRKHEYIQAGVEFDLRFMAPTKGILDPEQYEALLLVAGFYPRRGLSPARGRRYGRFEVLSFKNLGAIQAQGLRFIKDLIPEGNKYMREAVERLKKVTFVASFVGPDSLNDGNFPLFNESEK